MRGLSRNLGAANIARQTRRRLLHRVMLKTHRTLLQPRRIHLGATPVSLYRRANPILFLALIEQWELPIAEATSTRDC